MALRRCASEAGLDHRKPVAHGGVEVARLRIDEVARAVGHERTLPPANVRSFSAGSPTVAIHVDKGLIVVEGKQPGTTNVLLILSDGTSIRYAVTVTAKR